MYDSGYEPELDSSSDDNPLSELFAELRKISAHSKPLSTVNSEGVAKNETIEQKEPCHYEQVGDRWVVYRSRDRKVMKSINYFRPNLKKYLTEDEIKNV